ncbi:MAG TPA: ABC transporter ATP-binding protein [Geminicoccus sp.]|uniref:ABC transporter ATP-binding protein n=1 Tax=Geminicoccus sp. TaxID=2024832 RepID=UPI002C67F2FA|nr:ABC transporter ATP-binding protein [Geminicoccus sp.]HWL68984.1 ABC transporter ATP-binding protein [Geminicoccus sp.]
MAELVVSSLTRCFGAVTAVDRVSFTVRDGEFLTLLGPSGCGKSTTLAAIAGLERPTSGRISLGHDVYFDSDTNLFLPPERRNCGLVFQSYALWPHMTVEENCAFPLKLRRVPKEQRASQVREALALVEMERLADRYPHQLSGGQQQRVALARTLVFRPGILLLDEPLSNLDAKLRDRARSWLKHLQSKVGLTTVYVTHDQVEALAMSDRIAVMNGGRIAQLGTPKQIYVAPADRFVADLIGTSNMLDGDLKSDERGSFIRFADGQCLKIPAPPEKAGPRGCRCDPAGEHPPVWWSGSERHR